MLSNPIERPERSIEEVLDLDTGVHRPVADFLDRPEADVFAARLRLKQDEAEETKWLVCSHCLVPVYISGWTDQRTFWFKHRHERGDCPIKTKGLYDQKQINRIKYNGARESKAHIRLKALLAASLKADPRFSDVVVDERLYSVSDQTRWRQPDVRASANGQILAFEIQLSTTFIDVIMERWHFYKSEGIHLVWILPKFSPESQRFTEKDVLYANNRNIFIADDETLSQSKEERRLVLRAHYHEPTIQDGFVKPQWSDPRKISLEDLTLDHDRGRVFCFDAESAFAEAEARAKQGHAGTDLTKLRDDFERCWLERKGMEYKAFQRTLRRFEGKFRAAGLAPIGQFSIPRAAVLDALYCLKHGRVVGFGFPTVIQVAHRIVDGYKPHVLHFFWTAQAYGRMNWLLAQDKSGKLRVKLESIKTAMRGVAGEYKPDHSHDELLALLFPALAAQFAKRG